MSEQSIVDFWRRQLPTLPEKHTFSVPARDAAEFRALIGQPLNDDWVVESCADYTVEGYALTNVHLKRREPNFALAWKLESVGALGPRELSEAIVSDNRKKLLIAALVLEWDIWVCRADLQWFSVPRTAFTPNNVAVPDFENVAVADYGWTLALGKHYEASADYVFANARQLRP